MFAEHRADIFFVFFIHQNPERRGKETRRADQNKIPMLMLLIYVNFNKCMLSLWVMLFGRFRFARRYREEIKVLALNQHV